MNAAFRRSLHERSAATLTSFGTPRERPWWPPSRARRGLLLDVHRDPELPQSVQSPLHRPGRVADLLVSPLLLINGSGLAKVPFPPRRAISWEPYVSEFREVQGDGERFT